jgi:hypothetical protein
MVVYEIGAKREVKLCSCVSGFIHRYTSQYWFDPRNLRILKDAEKKQHCPDKYGDYVALILNGLVDEVLFPPRSMMVLLDLRTAVLLESRNQIPERNTRSISAAASGSYLRAC